MPHTFKPPFALHKAKFVYRPNGYYDFRNAEDHTTRGRNLVLSTRTRTKPRMKPNDEDARFLIYVYIEKCSLDFIRQDSLAPNEITFAFVRGLLTLGDCQHYLYRKTDPWIKVGLGLERGRSVSGW